MILENLKKPQDFAAAQARGIKFARPHLILLVADNPEHKESHIGYIISRKCGNAVKRNRIKRRLRAAVRQTIEAGTSHKGGKDFVIIGRAAAYGCDFADLLGDLHDSLQDYYRKTGLKD